MKKRFGSLLGHKVWAPLVIVVGVLLCAPSLGNGLYSDDYTHRLMVRGQHHLRAETGPFDLYGFIPDDPSVRARARETGAFPWWASEDLHISFWRPLSSLTLYVDHRLWPDVPWVMHAHSLLWLAGLLLAAWVAYRRFFGGGSMVGLAVALYALDDAHLFPTSWIAGRNGLVAALFAVLSLAAHDRWRRDGWRTGAFVGPLLLLTALLAGESAIGVVGFIVSHALFLDHGTWRQRLVTMAPYLVVVGLWQLFYVLLGHGTAGSGMYVHPLTQPLEFIVALGHRMPLLLLGMFGFPPSELHMFIPEAMRPAHIVFALLFVGFLFAVAWPLLRRDATARFWALGMVLALVPACAGFPNDRLLLIAGIGGMGLVAQLLGLFLERPDWRPSSWKWRVPAAIVVVVFIAIHLVLSPLSTPSRSTLVGTIGRSVERAARGVEPRQSLSEQTLVLVNAPDWSFAGGLVTVRAALGLETPRRFESLANALAETVVTREDERTLTVQVEGGHLNTWLHSAYRRSTDGFSRGQRVDREGVLYEIVTVTADGQPESVRVTFDRPLEDPSLRWITWEPRGYVEFALPDVGESVTIDLDDSYMTNPDVLDEGSRSSG